MCRGEPDAIAAREWNLQPPRPQNVCTAVVDQRAVSQLRMKIQKSEFSMGGPKYRPALVSALSNRQFGFKGLQRDAGTQKLLERSLDEHFSRDVEFRIVQPLDANHDCGEKNRHDQQLVTMIRQ